MKSAMYPALLDGNTPCGALRDLLECPMGLACQRTLLRYFSFFQRAGFCARMLATM